MEIAEDEYFNVNDLSAEEEHIGYLEDELCQEEPGIQDQLEDTELSSEMRKFQINLCEEIIQNSRAKRELSEGGYFDFTFSLCRKWISKYLEWNPECQASLIMELETFILLFQSREDPEDGALDPTISNFRNIKNGLLKHTINIDVAQTVYAMDRILELLERAKQWQKDTKALKRKDLYERDVQASLKELETSVNSLFRSTKEDKLDQCTSLMTALDQLKISPYWEESIYRYRLMYKGLLWIKQQSYSVTLQPHISIDTFEQDVEACNALAIAEVLSQFDEKTPEFSKNEYGIINAGYFDRRINEIYEVAKMQSRLGSEAPTYRSVCTVLETLRKLFNYGLQKKTFIVCIDQLCEPVHKKCQEYFFKLQGDNDNQELLITFEWLQKMNCLLDEIRNYFQDPEIILKDIQNETKNFNLEVGEAKIFQIWLRFWNAKFAMKELVRKDYQEIFQDLETIIEDMMEECIYSKSTELLERAFDIKEVCESLIIQVQAEESQIDWKTFRKRQFAGKRTRNNRR